MIEEESMVRKVSNNKKKGKGGGSTNNKKKNKGRGGGPISIENNNDCGSNKENLFQKVRNLPTFHHDDCNDRKSGGGYYGIYKQSTTNFWVWMKKVLPNSKIVSVNDLRRGADMILENNIASTIKKSSSSTDSNNNSDCQPDPIVIPSTIMKELSTSIKYREMLTETKFGGDAVANNNSGGDEGHRFIIDVLKYCSSVLRFGKNVARVAIMDSKNKFPDNDRAIDSCTKNEENRAGGDVQQGLDTIVGGRFNALILDEQEEEDDDEDLEAIEESIRERRFPTFEPPKEPEEDIDIEQVLINGDDRLQAIALLHTMDHMMSAVDFHYGILKNHLRGQLQHPDSPFSEDKNSDLQLLMECTVVSNMATESVRVAENDLYANHPHIQSFYHVLALVFFPPILADIKKKIVEESKGDCDPNAALRFVGDIVECSFHNRGNDKIPGRVKKFAKKLGIKLSYLEEQAKMIHMATSLETQLAMEEALNVTQNQFFESHGQLSAHSWLGNSQYIGGDRCILNTQNIVQKIMGIAQNTTKLVGRPGFWGPPFSFDDERKTTPSSTKCIRGDFDEPFAANILPELIAICNQAPFHALPEKSQLLTVLDLLHQYVRGDRTSPVPIALTFGLHAILTSMFVLHGEGDLSRLAECTKGSYNKLFAQLNAISDRSVTPTNNAPVFYSNIDMFKNIVNFAKPVGAQYDFQQAFLDPGVAEKLAFWNPLIGGEYLLYGTYLCSIGLGSATIDSMGQLRFTLHLYNALKQYREQQQQSSAAVAVAAALEVPIVQEIDKVFAKTKAVWVGGRPQKGSFCKHFWMAWGMSIGCATQLASLSSLDESRGMSSSKAFMASICKSRKQQQGPELTRQLDVIYPEEYSASYKRLVQKIFTDGNADYSVRNVTKEAMKKDKQFIDLLTQVNMTRDSMEEDDDFLPFNLPSVGCILLEFTNLLSKHMGWDDIIDEAMKLYPEEMREGKTIGGRKMKPGGFNSSDLNFKRQGMGHMWGSFLSLLDKASLENSGVAVAAADKAAEFMEEFFQGIQRERYVFLVGNEEENEAKTSSSRCRNPLEGVYPHGRSGKSPKEPMEGFFHFKYSKRGECKVRMIKPGKYTPYLPTPDGDVSTPYKEEGSKTKPMPSGKYRHIASYSLDELIDIGWDGAMYSSKTASGNYVPFVAGYDSDDSDKYEPIDIRAGKRSGIIGLPPNENGLYMTIPDFNNQGGRTLVALKNPT